MPKHLRRPEEQKDPYKAQPLPVERPVAVYYRQSTEAQIGNVSTTLQTVDMVEHLVKLGWLAERILMIDMDAGISGTKKINERPGMSQLFALIEARKVGCVAAQDVDRFFRDVTQIETNIFIDACRRNNVLVLTPTMVFDFAHPTQGRFHMQMFRDQAQRAADYIDHHIKGRLIKSKHWLQDRGLWVGGRIPPGYMVDMREQVEGIRNPNWRKFVPFPLYAEIVRAYFDLFRQYNGVQKDTAEHIWQQGPFYPEFTPELVPEGFYYVNRNTTRSPYTGKLCPAYGGLCCLLTNVVYLGHWTNSGAIVQWHNHEPLVGSELFMFAYNRISTKDFYGEPNADYMPHRPYTLRPKAQRTRPDPTYGGFLYSDDLPDSDHRRISTRWSQTQHYYFYALYPPNYQKQIWGIKADTLDETINTMLVERIQTTTLDERLWQEALAAVKDGGYQELQRLEHEIQAEKRSQDNIIASLSTLTNEVMVRRAQAQYEAAEQRIFLLEGQLQDLHALRQRQQHLIQARPALQRLVANWESIPREEKRNIFQDFAHEAHLNTLSSTKKQLTILWRDGSTSSQVIQRRTNGSKLVWDEHQYATLVNLIESDCDQVAILRTFPGYTWDNLQKRYIRHQGLRFWKPDYAGQRPYKKATRWEDTAEYQAEAQPRHDSKVATSLQSSRQYL